jgi:DNA polymerase-3 subunit delta
MPAKLGSLQKYQQLMGEIKRGVKPLYLFYGDEQFLVDRAASEVLRAANPGGSETFWGDEMPVSTLRAMVSTPSILGGNTSVCIKGVSWFDGANKETEQLLPLLERWPADTTVVFAAGTDVDLRIKLSKAVQKLGTVMQFDPVNRGEALSWLRQRFARQNGTITADALDRFVTLVGTDLNCLGREADKLTAYTGGRAVDVEAVEAVTSPTGEARVFDFIDAWLAGNPRLAYTELQKLWVAGQEPLAVIALMARQIRLLLHAREGLEAGIGPDRVAASLGVHPFAAQKAVAQARNHTQKWLIDGLDLLRDADLEVKTGKSEARLAVELVVAHMIS